jgi:hypothetical protein
MAVVKKNPCLDRPFFAGGIAQPVPLVTDQRLFTHPRNGRVTELGNDTDDRLVGRRFRAYTPKMTSG